MTFPSWVLVCKLINKVFLEECCWERGAHSTAWTLHFASIKQQHAVIIFRREVFIPCIPVWLWLSFSRCKLSAEIPLVEGEFCKAAFGVGRLFTTSPELPVMRLIVILNTYLFNRFVYLGRKSAMQTLVLAKGEEKVGGCRVWAVSDGRRLHFQISKPT